MLEEGERALLGSAIVDASTVVVSLPMIWKQSGWMVVEADMLVKEMIVTDYAGDMALSYFVG